MAEPASFYSLPMEIVCEIIQLLTLPSPSFERSGFRPSPNITDLIETNLKNLSRVCQGLRRLVIKELFRHVRLKAHITEFTWLNTRERYLCCIDSIEEVHSEGEFRHWPAEFHRMLDFLTTTGLAIHVESMAVIIEASEKNLASLSGAITTSIDDLWPRDFSAMLRLTVIAPFAILSELVGRSTANEIQANLKPLYQSLTLYATLPTQETYRQMCATNPINQYTAIRWDEIVLNEGTLRMGHHESYPTLLATMPPHSPNFYVTAPSIMRERSRAYLGACRTFTYVTVFPNLAYLIGMMTGALQHSPVVRLQLLPNMAECIGSEHEVGMIIGRVAQSIKSSFLYLIRCYLATNSFGWGKRLVEFHVLDPSLLPAPYIWADIVQEAQQKGWLHGWRVREDSDGNVLERKP